MAEIQSLTDEQNQLADQIRGTVNKLNVECKQAAEISLQVILERQEIRAPNYEVPRILSVVKIFKKL